MEAQLSLEITNKIIVSKNPRKAEIEINNK